MATRPSTTWSKSFATKRSTLAKCRGSAGRPSVSPSARGPSLLRHVDNYSPFGLGFTKPHVFAAGGGPAYYVRADHWEKQQWANNVKTFVTPFWPAYRPKTEKYQVPLGGKTIDYAHEREWRVPHDFRFEYQQVQFIVLPDYVTMAKFPAELKEQRRAREVHPGRRL